MTQKTKEFVTIDRSTVGIRDFIFDEMERLANGQSDVDRLKAMSKAGDTILKAAALDITVQKMISEEKRKGNYDFSGIFTLLWIVPILVVWLIYFIIF